MNAVECLRWTERLIAIAILLQTLELIQAQKAILRIWRWEILESEFRGKIGKLCGVFLTPQNFQILLLARVSACLALLVNSNGWVLGFLVFSTVLVNLRFRGTYNGGSDTMTFQIVATLFCAKSLVDFNSAQLAAVWYIAVQASLSYFIAGWIKILQPSWRNGRALHDFLQLHEVKWPVGRLSAWGIMLFECAFPVALFQPNLTTLILALAFTFHVINAQLLGLNRFLFAWAASYPAIIYCASIH